MSARQRFSYTPARAIRAATIASAFVFCGLSTGCDRTVAQPSSSDAAVVDDVKEFRSFTLTIYGYNYTDTEIGSFEVNGRGGGNIAVSTPTAPGGSSVCCAAVFTPIAKDRTFNIKWTRDGVTWCEQDVSFPGPVPSNADILEVHFYPDGRIELAATARPSEPRLKLNRLHGNSRNSDPSKNVINDTRFSRCKRGYN